MIIEAGGLNPNINNELYLNGKFFGDSDYETISYSRGRQFGGTGNFWGGNCNPIQEKEFNDWPIKKKNLDQYEEDAKKILNLKNDFFLEKFSDN